MPNTTCRVLAEHYKSMTDWVNWQIDELTDEEMKHAPGMGFNHGVWLLGHLVVSDDDLAIMLGKGDKLYPELFASFGQNSKCLDPNTYPSATELKEKWKRVAERNYQMILTLEDHELDEPHARVKDIETDFFKTKQRIISFWILHQQYHAGQLGLLNAKILRERDAAKE